MFGLNPKCSSIYIQEIWFGILKFFDSNSVIKIYITSFNGNLLKVK